MIFRCAPACGPVQIFSENRAADKKIKDWRNDYPVPGKWRQAATSQKINESFYRDESDNERDDEAHRKLREILSGKQVSHFHHLVTGRNAHDRNGDQE